MCHYVVLRLEVKISNDAGSLKMHHLSDLQNMLHSSLLVSFGQNLIKTTNNKTTGLV